MRNETLASEGYFHAGIAVPAIPGHPNKPWLDAKQEELKKLGIKCKIVLEGGCHVLYCEQRYFDFKEAIESVKWLESFEDRENALFEDYNNKLTALRKEREERSNRVEQARAAGLKI